MTMKPGVFVLVEEVEVVERTDAKEERRPLVSDVRVVARRVG